MTKFVLGDKVIEVGPVLGERVMSTNEVLGAFRALKRRGVPLSELARQIGYKPRTLSNLIIMGRFGPTIRGKISWLLRALLDGRLVVVKVGRGRGCVFLPSGKAIKDHDMVKALERCVCGKYATCPCLCHKPLWVKRKCPPLLSDAAETAVEKNTRQRLPSHDARTAAVLGASGSRSHLRLVRSPRG